MRDSRRLLVLCVLVLGFCGCDDPIRTEEERINNVVRVLMHERSKYTIVYESEDKELKMITVDSHYSENHNWDNWIKIASDVSVTERMWAKITWNVYRGNGGRRECKLAEYVEIHIHSAEDLNGAGWNHGKHGSGTTTVVK